VTQRYETGHVETEHIPWLDETITWMVVEMFELGGGKAWVSSAGDFCPLGVGPEQPAESRYSADRIARVFTRRSGGAS
jgi:hypothetical protein